MQCGSTVLRLSSCSARLMRPSPVSLPQGTGGSAAGQSAGSKVTQRVRSPQNRPQFQAASKSVDLASHWNPCVAGALANRGDRIRTCDLVLPKHPRYQAAPRPGHAHHRTWTTGCCTDSAFSSQLRSGLGVGRAEPLEDHDGQIIKLISA